MLISLCYQCLLYDSFYFALLPGLTSRNTVLWDLACKEALSTRVSMLSLFQCKNGHSCGVGQPKEFTWLIWCYPVPSFPKAARSVSCKWLGACVMCGAGELIATNYMMHFCLAGWLARHGSLGSWSTHVTSQKGLTTQVLQPEMDVWLINSERNETWLAREPDIKWKTKRKSPMEVAIIFL